MVADSTPFSIKPGARRPSYSNAPDRQVDIGDLVTAPGPHGDPPERIRGVVVGISPSRTAGPHWQVWVATTSRGYQVTAVRDVGFVARLVEIPPLAISEECAAWLEGAENAPLSKHGRELFNAARAALGSAAP